MRCHPILYHSKTKKKPAAAGSGWHIRQGKWQAMADRDAHGLVTTAR
jgi:hypothetical protein